MSDAAKTFGKAQLLHQQGQLAEARKLYARILKQDKNNAATLFQLATLEAQDGNYALALDFIDRALKNAPPSADGTTLKGRILNALARHDDALACYEKALQVNPRHPAALLNIGGTFLLLNLSCEALDAFDRLVTLMPREPLAHHNRAIALTDLEQYQKAIASADEALRISPNYAEALQARGIAHGYSHRHDLALRDFKAAFRINPNLENLIGNLVNAQQWACDWENLAESLQTLLAGLKAGRRVVTPFSFTSMSYSADDQLACAKIYMASKSTGAIKALWSGERYAHDRIRLAYLSADLREHPTSYLMAGVFEQHDRSRFETTAISFGPDTPSEMLTRLKSSFDKFVNVKGQSDAEVAKLLRSREIDIAVDLMGYTGGGRAGILAHRAAPVQVDYLAYPGTMGANYMDYLIADAVLIPKSEQKHYSEKIAYLPHTYAPTDSKRAISDKAFSRAEMGLPQNGFIFCCFNNSYKFNPSMLDRLTRLLKRVDGSVLWLPEHNDIVTTNLKKETGLRGVSADRIVFAKRMPEVADHLARLRLADLFLDTLPSNAHTTASDALWAGVPLLTQIGQTFAGRVAASLLTAAGLPELITTTPEAYEELAVDLATNPAKLAAIRQKLAANRLTMPLFGTQKYTRSLEAAYIAMHERAQAGLPPDYIYVPR